MTSNIANTGATDDLSMTIEPVMTKPTETSAAGYFLRKYDNFALITIKNAWITNHIKSFMLTLPADADITKFYDYCNASLIIGKGVDLKYDPMPVKLVCRLASAKKFYFYIPDADTYYNFPTNLQTPSTVIQCQDNGAPTEYCV